MAVADHQPDAAKAAGAEEPQELGPEGLSFRRAIGSKQHRQRQGQPSGICRAIPYPPIPCGLCMDKWELSNALADDLAEIEITPAGLALHWPRLDANVYVPGLMQGIYGTRRWMAAQLGAAGGSATSPAKAAAARENGRKGGRPRKQA